MHEYTREEMKIAFDQADQQKNGHLSFEELQNSVSYLNLHLPHQQLIQSKSLLFLQCLTKDSV